MSYELPEREWVVIFYPNTGMARLCPTLDFARNTVAASTFDRHVYKSPNDLRVRHDHFALESAWKTLHKSASWKLSSTAIGRVEDYPETPPDLPTEEFAKQLWEFIQDVGDRLKVVNLDTTIKVKENYELKLGPMGKLIGDWETFKKTYNNQARAVFCALYEYQEQFLTEDQIRKIIYNLVVERKLKTKQEPWIIFQYYRPQFIKDGYVIRGRGSKSRS